MKYFLLLLLILLVGCERRLDLDASDYKTRIDNYCLPCGGTKTAFINESGQQILCIDGHKLSQNWTQVPNVLILGTCK